MMVTGLGVIPLKVDPSCIVHTCVNGKVEVVLFLNVTVNGGTQAVAGLGVVEKLAVGGIEQVI